jgi:hypothetical protein
VTVPGVLVLGMHRSGTSALTRALGLLGPSTGKRSAVMGAAPSNATGHWELTALTETSDALLGLFGGRWSAPPPLSVDDLIRTVDEPIGEEARALVDTLLPEVPWAWKDPRLCLTLPFWEAVLGARHAKVVSLRHPLEVAASLQRRNGFSMAYGLALWERYLRSMWANLEGSKVMVVDYDTVLDERRACVDQLADYVEQCTGIAAPAAARAVATTSLDSAQRHHVLPDADLAVHPDATPQQCELYERSRALIGEHERLPAVGVADETPGLQLAFDEHERMSRFEDDALRLRAALNEATAGLDRQTLFFHQELERRSAEASVLATDVMAARDQLADLQASMDRMRRRLPIRAYLAVRRRLPGGKG